MKEFNELISTNKTILLFTSSMQKVSMMPLNVCQYTAQTESYSHWSEHPKFYQSHHASVYFTGQLR